MPGKETEWILFTMHMSHTGDNPAEIQKTMTILFRSNSQLKPPHLQHVSKGDKGCSEESPEDKMSIN